MKKTIYKDFCNNYKGYSLPFTGNYISLPTISKRGVEDYC